MAIGFALLKSRIGATPALGTPFHHVTHGKRHSRQSMPTGLA
jgi:hypothetical protein